MGDQGGLPFDLGLLADPEAEEPRREREWNRLFHTLTPRLRNYFAARVESEDDLDDLVAQIWRRAVLRISTVEAADAMWTWLVTIGVNLLRDQGRSRTRRNRNFGLPSSIDEAEADRALVERLAGDFLSTALVRDAVQRVRELVSDQDWELLQLWAVDELTHTEIADRLDLPSAQASRQRVSRLCGRLRRQLPSGAKEAT